VRLKRSVQACLWTSQHGRNFNYSFGIGTASFMAWQADQKKMTCQPTLDQYLLLSNYRVFPQDGLLRLP